MIEGGQASLKVWEDRKGVVRGLEKLRREDVITNGYLLICDW